MNTIGDVNEAFNKLKEMGCPVINHVEISTHNADERKDKQWGAWFIISGELRDSKDHYWADWYGYEVAEWYDEGTDTTHNESGIKDEVHKILDECGLRAEWIDPGTVGVYDS